MSLIRTLSALVCAFLLVLGGTVHPAAAEPAPPVGPQAVDPLISVLPAAPVPYRPYTSRICRSGKPVCITRVIREMEQRLRPLAASCDHDAIFSLAYLRVTQNVKEAADSGYFADRIWLTRLDAVFADLYFRTMDAWHSGRRRAVPPAWRIALKAADDRSLTGLGDFMINMNAHINNDFPHALVTAGLTDRRGRTHKPDHNAYNRRLDDLYAPVFAEMARRFDPTIDDQDAGPVDETAAGLVMRGWREMVWRNAEHLAMARTPAQRAAAERTIEEYAASQARLIRQAYASPDGSAARDAWCRAQRQAGNHR